MMSPRTVRMKGVLVLNYWRIDMKWVIRVGNDYGAFIFEGTEDEAEEMRKHKARHEQANARKRLADEAEIKTGKASYCLNHPNFKHKVVFSCDCDDCKVIQIKDLAPPRKYGLLQIKERITDIIRMNEDYCCNMGPDLIQHLKNKLHDIELELDYINNSHKDELGGRHHNGVGWNPHGVFCGECVLQSCLGCSHADETE